MLPVPGSKSANSGLALERGLLFAGLSLAISGFFLPFQNPDFFWHYSAGRLIVETGAIPRSDFLSWSKAGGRWVDLGWLSQVFYYLIYSLGGYWALMALKAGLFCASLFVFIKTLRLGGSGKMVFAAAPVWAAAMLPNLDIRPENWTLLFFSLELYLLEKMRLGGMPRDWRGYPIAAFFGFAVWANLHTGFIYGLALIALYAAAELLGALAGSRPAADFAELRALGASLAGGFLGSLATPFLFDTYSAAFEHGSLMGLLQSSIVEWAGPDLLSPFLTPYWLLFAAAFAVMAWRTFKYGAEWHFLLPVIYFAWASAQHRRHTMFFVAVALPYVMRAFGGEGAPRPRRWLPYALFALVLFQFYRFIWPEIPKMPWAVIRPAEGAVEFLSRNSRVLGGLKLYNPWNWGGYAGYRLYPEYRIFQDGRYIFHGYLAEVRAAKASPELWQEFLDKYGIQLVLIEYSDRLLPADAAVRPFMPAGKWALVYRDGGALVFARSAAVAAGRTGRGARLR